MWNESGAAIGDFTRVVALVRSQYVFPRAAIFYVNSRFTRRVKVALRQEHLRPWHEMVQDFSDCEYRGVRDRQMKELEEEDDLLSKIPVRNLRAKLYKESKEFVRQQRIHCLMQGAWFLNAVPISAPAPRRPARPWRFMRLVRPPPFLPLPFPCAHIESQLGPQPEAPTLRRQSVQVPRAQRARGPTGAL